MFKHHFAKTKLNDELCNLGYSFEAELNTTNCAEMLGNLNNFCIDHDDSEIIDSSNVCAIQPDAFGCEFDNSNKARNIKQACLDGVKLFLKQYDIDLKDLSLEAQKNFCKLIIDAEKDSDIRSKMADELHFREDPLVYLFGKALEHY